MMKYSMIAIVVMTMASGSVFADNSENAIGTGVSFSGISKATAVTATTHEAFSGTGDKTVTGKPALPAFSGTSPRMTTAPVASITGNQSVPAKAPVQTITGKPALPGFHGERTRVTTAPVASITGNQSVPDKGPVQTITGKPALPAFSGERPKVTVAPRASFVGNQSVPTPVNAPDQMKGKSIAPQVANNTVSHPTSTINVSAGSLKPDTAVKMTDPATGKTTTVAAKRLNPSVQVAMPVQSAFVRPHNGNGNKSGSVNRSEHGTGTGGDNAHDHAFGGHTGAGRGFHM